MFCATVLPSLTKNELALDFFGAGSRRAYLLRKYYTSGRRLGKSKMQAFFSFLSAPTSDELRFSSYYHKKYELALDFLVLGVGVEPTKAEAGRFTV